MKVCTHCQFSEKDAVLIETPILAHYLEYMVAITPKGKAEKFICFHCLTALDLETEFEKIFGEIEE